VGVAVAFHVFLPRVRAGENGASADSTFFEMRIRPLLAEHCYSCHGEEKQKGHLRLDSRAAMLKGGESGPAIVPGQPGQSRLMEAVRYQNPDLQMPPKKRLTDRQVSDLSRWIASNAPWPAHDAARAAATTKTPAEITAQERAWWSFQPIRRPPVPAPRGGQQKFGSSPIDAFIAEALRQKGLSPNPPASRRELIRRAYFDLLGLPPEPEAVLAFERDRSPDAWSRLLDELLARPQYGERWARHWLDVVRFAQSNGYERDGEKPLAWRYRDYVVRAFNSDKPYDQFVREQIAGDELEPRTDDGIIATGFQRLGVWDDEPDDKRMAEFDELDDILSTTGTALLGLTLGCARCHEHKFDPIPQADYYRLLAFFRNVSLYDNAKYTLDSPNYVPLGEPAKIEAWRAAHESKIKALANQANAATNAAAKKSIEAQLEKLKNESAPFEWALAVKERGTNPPPTHVLIRGNAGSPGAEIEPAFLSVLGARRPALPSPSHPPASSGRRRVLAEWIASAENPLTARVIANRIWQHHFGRGLVSSTSDFGKAGTAPTHPQLLDWLAAELIAQGWSLKALHKSILVSAAYQMSSRADNARAIELDPSNNLLWRQNLRRLEAETLRDTVLAVSGQLNETMGGRGFFPRLSGEVLAGQSRPGLDWELSTPAELSRRSLYVYVRRTMAVPLLEAFDYNNTATPVGERAVTTVAPQALMLLNDEFMQRQSEAFAARLFREAGPNTDAMLRRGFAHALGRHPTAAEERVAREFLRSQERTFAQRKSSLLFHPEVPASLSVDYLRQLEPADFLGGPASGWTYHRGSWSPAYEGIRTVERARGPFALYEYARFSNGVITARLTLHTASESAGLVVRAVTDGDELRGYELALDPRRQLVSIRRHGKQLATLAETHSAVPTGQALTFRVELAGPRLRVWREQLDTKAAGATPLFDVTDTEPWLLAGRVGVRSWGAPLSVEELAARSNGGSWQMTGVPPTLPAQEALAAFCLLLLNLNELVYVD